MRVAAPSPMGGSVISTVGRSKFSNADQGKDACRVESPSTGAAARASACSSLENEMACVWSHGQRLIFKVLRAGCALAIAQAYRQTLVEQAVSSFWRSARLCWA